MKSTKAVKASSPLLPTTTATTITTTTAMISANPPILIATAIAIETATVIVIVTMTGATVTETGNKTEIDVIETVSAIRMLSLAIQRGLRNWQSVRKRNSDSRIWFFFFCENEYLGLFKFKFKFQMSLVGISGFIHLDPSN